MATVIIRNGLVCDGSEHAPRKVDVFVYRDRIARLGDFSKARADIVLDASGALVTPGFVDVNTDSDHYLSLFREPYQQDFLRQGVTSILGGNCGVSLAPLIGTPPADLIGLWSDFSGVNVDWHSMEEFLRVVGERKIGVNFGTLVGHRTLRLPFDKTGDLSDRQLEVMGELLRQSMREGAFGVSTVIASSLLQKFARNELECLAKVVGEMGGVWALHLENTERNIDREVADMLDIAARTGANLEISHFQPVRGVTSEYEKALTSIEKASAGYSVNFDVFPFDSKVLPMLFFMPQWTEGGDQEDADHEALKKHFAQFRSLSPIIAHTFDASFKFLEGKAIDAIAKEWHLSFEEAFLRMMRTLRGRASLCVKNIDMDALTRFMLHPQALIASNGASMANRRFSHERNTRTFPVFLKLVTQNGGIPIEKAIAKITSIPSKKFRLKKRGLIKENYYADIVVLRNYEPSEVLVNGVFALRGGKVQQSLAGSPLYFSP